MQTVRLHDMPAIRGIQLTSCKVESRFGGEAKITYGVVANQKMLSMLKKFINQMEAYASYKNWYENSKTLVVLISCRDGENPVQAAKLFTAALLGAIQTELEARAAVTTTNPVEEYHSESRRGRSPSYRRPRHRQLAR